MRLFVSSPVDYRRLSMLPQDIIKMHPGRREHIYGKIHPMDCKCGGCNG